jgi:hypothetical protein
LAAPAEAVVEQEMPSPDLLLPLDFASQLFDTAEKPLLEPASDLQFPGVLELPVAAPNRPPVPMKRKPCRSQSPNWRQSPELDPQAIYFEAEQEAEEQPTPTVEE